MKLTVSAQDKVWIDKRLAEGRHLDIGDFLRDLIRRDQEGLLPDRRTMLG